MGKKRSAPRPGPARCGERHLATHAHGHSNLHSVLECGRAVHARGAAECDYIFKWTRMSRKRVANAVLTTAS